MSPPFDDGGSGTAQWEEEEVEEEVEEEEVAVYVLGARHGGGPLRTAHFMKPILLRKLTSDARGLYFRVPPSPP